MIKEEMFTQLEALHSTQVLIVDDDLDSALLTESVFSHLGCKTMCSLSSAEAKKKICSYKADLIIMDWVLDHDVEANLVVQQCADIFTKYGSGPGHGLWQRPKVITYSGLDESQITLLSNPYFIHYDHWTKPLTQRQLLGRILDVLGKMGH